MAVLNVLSRSPLPVGVRTDDGGILVLEGARGADEAAPRLCVVEPLAGRKSPVGPSDLSFPDLIRLVEQGQRGANLQSMLSSHPADSVIDVYRHLVADIKASSMDRGYDLMQQHEARTQGEPGLLGKIYRENAADGYAYYMVTQERGSQVRLCLLPVMDSYRSIQLGEDSWVDRSSVERVMNAFGAFQKAASSKKAAPGRW